MRRWKRPLWEERTIIGYVSMLILLVILVVMFVSERWSIWWFEALGAIGLLLLRRHVRSGIYVNGSGVRVIRFYSSEILPWDQLAAVEVRSDDLIGRRAHPTVSGHPQILLRTTSGAIIPTKVYRGNTGRRNDFWLRPKTVDRLVARLRELHQQYVEPSPN